MRPQALGYARVTRLFGAAFANFGVLSSIAAALVVGPTLAISTPRGFIMNKTSFRLKVAGVALLLASSIAIVIVVAQRPQASVSGGVHATALRIGEE